MTVIVYLKTRENISSTVQYAQKYADSYKQEHDIPEALRIVFRSFQEPYATKQPSKDFRKRPFLSKREYEKKVVQHITSRKPFLTAEYVFLDPDEWDPAIDIYLKEINPEIKIISYESAKPENRPFQQRGLLDGNFHDLETAIESLYR